SVIRSRSDSLRASHAAAAMANDTPNTSAISWKAGMRAVSVVSHARVAHMASAAPPVAVAARRPERTPAVTAAGAVIGPGRGAAPGPPSWLAARGGSALDQRALLAALALQPQGDRLARVR